MAVVSPVYQLSTPYHMSFARTLRLQETQEKVVVGIATLTGIAVFLMLPHAALAATPILENARITGPNTVVLSFSEPVYTTLNDYSNFNGSLSGASLSSASGSGSSVVTLTFSGVSFPPGAAGGLTIANTLTSVSDGYAIGAGPVNVVNGQVPILSSVSVSSSDTGGTVAQSNDTMTVSFSANEPLQSATVSIDGHSLYANGSGSGPYSASYTISGSDTQNTVPVVLTFTDASGNVGREALTLGSGGGPSIVSITSNANTSGTLVPGGTITFTLTLATPSPNATVQGSYDGELLTWTSGNGGATYNATYTVESGNASTYSPLQISGVTVTDPSGNVSAPASGTDVLETVNAQSFSISQMTPIPGVVTTATPQYAFYASQDGSMRWGGDCSSSVLSAVSGDNYITLNALPNGTHSNCTLAVVDGAGNASNTLTLPAFTVEAGATNTAVPVVSSGSTSSNSSEPCLNSSSLICAYKFYKPLDLGATGADVTAVQERLTTEGVYTGPVTGYYGALTQAAVKEFQALHALNQLGNVGPGTRSLLNSGI